MKNLVIGFLILSLITPAFADPNILEARKSKPENSKRSNGNPDRGSDAGRPGNGPDGPIDDWSPDDRGSGRGGYDDVDWTWGGNGGGSRDWGSTDRFLALREVFQSVDPGFKNLVQSELRNEVGVFAVIMAAATATWVYIKNNPSKALPKIFARAAGVATVFGTASAIAKPDYESMAHSNIYVLFESKGISEDEALRLSQMLSLQPQIDVVIQASENILCQNLDKEQNLSVIRFCELSN